MHCKIAMDVYSCRDFDPMQVEQHREARLGAYDVRVTEVSAALHYEIDVHHGEHVLAIC